MDTHHFLSFNDQGQSPISIAPGVEEEIEIIEYHSFGCLVLMLDEKTQRGLGGTPTYDHTSRTVTNLRRSPTHASSVEQFLNLSTGYVIPQHHLFFDDEF